MRMTRPQIHPQYFCRTQSNLRYLGFPNGLEYVRQEGEAVVWMKDDSVGVSGYFGLSWDLLVINEVKCDLDCLVVIAFCQLRPPNQE